MIGKFLLLTCCAAALAQGQSHEETLKQLTEEGGRRVLQVANGLGDPTEEYLALIDERRESLEWDHVAHMEKVNASLTAALFKGMLRNNQFSNFQCIANAGRDIFAKIGESATYVQNGTEAILNRGLEGVRTLRLIIPGLFEYVQDLYRTKSEELKKASDENAKNKILEKAQKKFGLLDTILKGIADKAKEIKFRFFEEYVKYAYDTENYLRRTTREGAQRIFKCVA